MAAGGGLQARRRSLRGGTSSAHHGRPLKAVGCAAAAVCGLLLSHLHGSFAAFAPSPLSRQRAGRVRLLAASDSELTSKKAELAERLQAEATAAKKARSKGFAINTQSFEALIESFDSERLGPVEATDKLLTTDGLQHDDASLKKLEKATLKCLARGDHDSLHLTVDRLLQWPGLEPTQDDASAIKNAQFFPVVYTVFSAVRSYCNENADFFDMVQLGMTLEALMKLARKMWAADDRVNNAMTLILNKELYEKGRDPIDGPADIIGTLGLRETFQVMAHAALDMPKDEMKHVDAVSSMGQPNRSLPPLRRPHKDDRMKTGGSGTRHMTTTATAGIDGTATAQRGGGAPTGELMTGGDSHGEGGAKNTDMNKTSLEEDPRQATGARLWAATSAATPGSEIATSAMTARWEATTAAWIRDKGTVRRDDVYTEASESYGLRRCRYDKDAFDIRDASNDVGVYGTRRGSGDELGATARSYLRQIAAWRKMTRLPVQQQALVLDQNLTNRAWVEAERLSVDKLASSEGIAYFEDWIKERYLDVQVTQIGRSLSEFFRKLRKKPGQSIRDCIGEFDRAHARLVECGCHLPDLASAWVFVDRMELEESSELNLLASVNNTYDLQKLQRAAIVHDRALRKPWESQKGDGKGGRWWKGRPQMAHITEDGEFNEIEADPFGDEGEAMSEEIATELYETYMTHEAAKNKYREHNKLRGASPGALRRISEEKMRMAKARSFCAGCKRKGHWHRDAECPLNQGNHGKATTPAATTTSSTTAGTSGSGQAGMGGHRNYQCHVVHVTWDLGETPPKELNAITDTACSRSVAGAPWLERYLKVTAELGYKPQFLGGRESFKFGASTIFDSKYSVVIAFQMGDYVLQVRTAIVEGDVPLLLSKPTLGAMGMIYDVARNRANFTSLELCDFPLSATETGHPAIPFVPVQAFAGLPQDWEANGPEIKISKHGAAYKGVWEAHMTSFGILGDPQHHEATSSPLTYDQRLVEINNYRIFYPKKLPPATRNMLLDRDFHEGATCLKRPPAPRVDMEQAPVPPKTNVWHMNKTELLSEATRCGLAVSSTWNRDEIRSIIAEHRAAEKGNNDQPIKGMGSMTLEQLKAKARENQIELPAKPTKGWIMRMLRTATAGADQDIMTFGRYKHWEYQSVPQGYRDWAEREVAANTNASEDLRRFAHWCASKRTPTTASTSGYIGVDPETDPVIPLPDTGSSTAWSMVPPISDPGRASTTPLPPTPRTAGGAHTMDHGEDLTDGGRCRSGGVGGDRGLGGEAGYPETGAWTERSEIMNGHAHESYINDTVDHAEEHYDLGGDPKNHEVKYNMDGDSMNPPQLLPECAGGDPEGGSDNYHENQFEIEEVYGEDENDYYVCADDHLQRDRQPVFWQLYTKDGEMAKAMEDKGYRVVCFERPEWDFGRKTDRDKVWSLFHQEPPDVIWMAPPHALWNPKTVEDKDAEALEVMWSRRALQHKTHLSLVRRLYRKQTRRRKTAVLEHPGPYSGWTTPALKNLGGNDVILYDQFSTTTDYDGDRKATMIRVNESLFETILTTTLKKTNIGASDESHENGIKGAEYYAIANTIEDLRIKGEPPTEELTQEANYNHPHQHAAEEEYHPNTAAIKAIEDEDYTYETLEKIAEGIRIPGRRRHKAEGDLDQDSRIFIGGLWQYGNRHGITNGTYLYPDVTRYVNNFVRRHGGEDHQWTSFYLGRNIETKLHVDSHNLAGTQSATLSFGDFGGGGLWVAARDKEESTNGGVEYDTKHNLTTIDAKLPHKTMPWKGTRWCLSVYTGRSLPYIGQGLRQKLLQFNFPVNDLRKRRPLYEQHQKPKKSIRRGLWKNAKRVSYLATWSILAAMSFGRELLLPPPGDREQVLLFELGGRSMSYEAADKDYKFVEPLVAEDLVDHGGINLAHEALQEFSPKRLWVHGDELVNTFRGGVDRLVATQLKAGGNVTIEGDQNGSFWNSKAGRDLLQEHHQRLTSAFGKFRLDLGERDYPHHPGGNDETQEAYPADVIHDNPRPTTTGAKAISFSKGTKVRPEVASALRRLHQNLGHPDAHDLARHLRLAGADQSVIDAAKGLRCMTCERNQRGGTAKPSAMPTILEFNQVVGVDAFSVVDSSGTRYEMLSAVDHGTGFHLVAELKGHTAQIMEKTFCEMWSNTFGPPGTLAIDLETGLQAGLAKYAEWFGSRIRPSAGQAHWQLGTAERHGGLWKEIFAKVTDEFSVTEADLHLCITAVNAAKNQLKRRSGVSPSQMVWGREPRVPGELLGDGDGRQEEFILSHDKLRAKEHSMRCAAKAAYFRCQGDQRIRRALLQRSRVAPGTLEVGDVIYFYRKPKDSKNWIWRGPATVIGHEGPNTWASFGGRCHLVAPEHARLATSEELGEAFSLKTTKDDLLRLLEGDPDDPLLFTDEPEPMMTEEHEIVESDFEIPSEFMPTDAEDDEVMEIEQDEEVQEGRAQRREAGEDAQNPRRKRLRGKTTTGAVDNTVYMLKKPTTRREHLKQLEKEIPWTAIPEERRAAFKAAELTQWQEHVRCQALQPVGVQESREIMRTRPERVLPSRFAYRDKNFAKRRISADTPWRHKSRLVVGGHLDPDIASGQLATSAPTVSRLGILTMLQICASRKEEDWTAAAGDVTAAFLNGEPLSRELYIRQPRGGLGDLHPEQLVKLTKWVFGLTDSPNAWWQKLKTTITEIKFTIDNGEKTEVTQCPLDPCIFQIHRANQDGTRSDPIAYIGIHVDDILLVGKKAHLQEIKGYLNQAFPVDEWIFDCFEYVGSQVNVGEEGIEITQSGYTASRLFEVEVHHGQRDEDEATPEQIADNRSLVGALSWLSSQSRPDLQAGVSMSNKLSAKAKEHQERVVLRAIPLDNAILLSYHDAGWSNAPQNHEDPYYQLYVEDEESGRILEGPLAARPKKPKTTTPSVASQLGTIFLLAPKEILHGEPHKVSLLDWKSHSSDRVCRSTFASETMACADALEGGDYIRALMETLLRGRLSRPHQARINSHLITDCRSLFDHLRKEGIPRPPADRRLAIDLASIRQDLPGLSGIAWVPTDLQYADVLTKPKKSGEWWDEITRDILLPFSIGKDVRKISKAWALATANVPLASLQIKVAKGILANIDKVMPPDIGKIFVAMHELEWFKDKDSIAYLTQALVARVQTLKQE
ncbi:RE2, partial [Symbiodinium sp. KB8]